MEAERKGDWVDLVAGWLGLLKDWAGSAGEKGLGGIQDPKGFPPLLSHCSGFPRVVPPPTIAELLLLFLAPPSFPRCLPGTPEIGSAPG